jgi:hypothetical protein
VTELVTFLLPAVPLLALLLALLFGHYPGCEAIVRLSERIATWGRPRFESSASRRPAHRQPPLVRAGGLLLALSLFGRAPPAAV